MDKTKQPATQPGRIPVLFDVVERGENAPEENRIKPPPSPEISEFNLDEPKPDSEGVTGPSASDSADITAFSFGVSEDITDEIPILTDSTPETERKEFTLGDREKITEEISIVPPDMLKDGQARADELVEQAMQELMPQLEALARETLYQLTHIDKTDEETDQKE